MHTKPADTFCIHFLVAEKRYQVEIKHYMENLKTTPLAKKQGSAPFFVQIILSISSICLGVSSIP